MEKSKRTTVILNEKDREYLEELIESGKEAGIKPFITKMLDIYRNMAINDWRFPGECYVGASRVAFISQESLNALTEMIPPEKREETGRKLGEAHRNSLLSGFGLDSTKEQNWDEVFKKLRILGYGEITRRGDMLVFRNPICGDVEVLKGFFETLLKIPVKARTAVSPVILEVERASGVA